MAKPTSIRLFALLFAFVLSFSNAHSTATSPQLKVCYVVDMGNLLAREFARTTGVKVQSIRLPGSGMALHRIRSNQSTPFCDVWFGGSIGAHAQASYEGLTAKYQSINISKLDKRYRDPLGDNRVTGIYTGTLVFISNKNTYKSLQLPLPKSWTHLLNNELKNRIGVKSPLVSGTAYTMLSTLVQLMGEDNAYGYLRSLHQNTATYTNSHIELVKTGHLGTIVTFYHELHDLIPNHLEVTLPVEGTGYEIGGLSLVANGKNRKNAEQFIDFVLSDHSAEIIRTATNSRQYTHTVLGQNEFQPLLKNAKILPLDIKWFGENRQRLIDRYQREVIAFSNSSKNQ